MGVILRHLSTSDFAGDAIRLHRFGHTERRQRRRESCGHSCLSSMKSNLFAKQPRRSSAVATEAAVIRLCTSHQNEIGPVQSVEHPAGPAFCWRAGNVLIELGVNAVARPKPARCLCSQAASSISPTPCGPSPSMGCSAETTTCVLPSELFITL
jgi:hypothetical protein